jgi:hypothetical protein
MLGGFGMPTMLARAIVVFDVDLCGRVDTVDFGVGSPGTSTVVMVPFWSMKPLIWPQAST